MATFSDNGDWARRPDKSDMPMRYEVNRAGPKGHLIHLILSHDVDGAHIHFYRGRSARCGGEKCDACLAGIRKDWRGYLIVTTIKTRVLSLMELTPAAMPPVDVYFRTHRTLRGAFISTIRIPAEKNGRLRSTLEESCYNVENFPKPPPVRQILKKLWGLKDEPEPQNTVDRNIRLRLSDEELRDAS